MDVVYEFWVIASPAFIAEARHLRRYLEDDGPLGVDNPATTFPGLNFLGARSKRLLGRSDPLWKGAITKPCNIYSTVVSESYLGNLTEFREDLQALTEQVSPDFIFAGAWVVATGEPIGGVGSPWVATPPELADEMPESVYYTPAVWSSDGPVITATYGEPVEVTGIEQIPIIAGGQRRKFV